MSVAATPQRGEERLFDMFKIEEAAEWARRGGIAIHRNFDVDGLKIGTKVREGPAFHVFGQEKVLLEWGRRHRLKPTWLQYTDEDRREGWPPHFDVFGKLAEQFEARRLAAGGEQ